MYYFSIINFLFGKIFNVCVVIESYILILGDLRAIAETDLLLPRFMSPVVGNPHKADEHSLSTN